MQCRLPVQLALSPVPDAVSDPPQTVMAALSPVAETFSWSGKKNGVPTLGATVVTPFHVFVNSGSRPPPPVPQPTRTSAHTSGRVIGAPPWDSPKLSIRGAGPRSRQ